MFAPPVLFFCHAGICEPKSMNYTQLYLYPIEVQFDANLKALKSRNFQDLAPTYKEVGRRPSLLVSKEATSS